jgi:hypothetical protein
MTILLELIEEYDEKTDLFKSITENQKNDSKNKKLMTLVEQEEEESNQNSSSKQVTGDSGKKLPF